MFRRRVSRLVFAALAAGICFSSASADQLSPYWADRSIVPIDDEYGISLKVGLTVPFGKATSMKTTDQKPRWGVGLDVTAAGRLPPVAQQPDLRVGRTLAGDGYAAFGGSIMGQSVGQIDLIWFDLLNPSQPFDRLNTGLSERGTEVIACVAATVNGLGGCRSMP